MGDVIDEFVYRASVTVSGGRVGHAASDDGLLDVEFARPGSHAGTNPEQMLAAGWGACFLSTIHAVGRKAAIDTENARVVVEVTLGKTVEKFFALEAEIHASLPGVAAEDAMELVEEAHKRCPYSRALSPNIKVRISVGESASELRLDI